MDVSLFSLLSLSPPNRLAPSLSPHSFLLSLSIFILSLQTLHLSPSPLSLLPIASVFPHHTVVLILHSPSHSYPSSFTFPLSLTES